MKTYNTVINIVERYEQLRRLYRAMLNWRQDDRRKGNAVTGEYMAMLKQVRQQITAIETELKLTTITIKLGTTTHQDQWGRVHDIVPHDYCDRF